MKKALLLIAIVLFHLSAAAQSAPAEKIVLPGSKLDNFYKIDEKVYRSEQPSKADFAALEKYGIREVLNMRNFHNDEDEARGTSLVLHRVASRAGRLTIEQLTEALRIIRDARGPILVHCWHGSDRTGAVIAMYRIVFQGVEKEVAIREMTGGGFGFHSIYDNIPATIRATDIGAIRRELGLPYL